MPDDNAIKDELTQRFGADAFQAQTSVDDILTLWLEAGNIVAVVKFLKTEIDKPYNLLYDVSAIDERDRMKKQQLPLKDFTVVYHLFSFDRNAFIRLKVPLEGPTPSLSSITSLFKNANWYEREVFDMFGISFNGHPHLQRILMPHTWTGHPLRKEH